MTEDPLDILKKSIHYKAIHRGTKEADFLIGGFVRHCLETLSPNELVLLKQWVEMDDQSFFAQLKEPTHALTPLIEKFYFYQQKG